jgi:hypothetical protein
MAECSSLLLALAAVFLSVSHEQRVLGAWWRLWAAKRTNCMEGLEQEVVRGYQDCSRAVRQAKQIHAKLVVWDIDMIQEASKCHPVKVLGWGNEH